MRTRITYITEDGKEFDGLFQAKRHECEMTSHRWEYYTENLVKQPELTLQTNQRFCKSCHKQEFLN